MGYLLLFLVLNGKTINHLKKTKMKNSFKIGFLALAIAVSAAACKGKSGASGSDTTAKDTTAKMADTTKKK